MPQNRTRLNIERPPGGRDGPLGGPDPRRGTAPRRDEPESGSSFAARFGRIILNDGIAAIPAALFHYQGKLDLDAHHVWFISYILSHKWDEDLPYPSLNKMAHKAGLHSRTLSRYSKDLCAMGYLQVYRRFTDARGVDTNAYDFRGLFERLEELIAADPPRRNAIRAEGDPFDAPDTYRRDNSFVARFGRVISRYGVAAIPKALFSFQKEMGLDPQQVWLICYILSYQWDTALPYPSVAKMAAQTGYSKVRLHEIKASLVETGYLRIIHRQTDEGGWDANAYDFSGLMDAIRERLEPREKEETTAGLANIAGDYGETIEGLPRRKRRGANGRPAARPTDTEFTRVPDNSLTTGSDSQFIRPTDNKITRVTDTEFTWDTASRHTKRVKPAPGGPPTPGLPGPLTKGVHKVEAQKEALNRDDSNQLSPIENGKIEDVSQGKKYPIIPGFSPYMAAIITDFSLELEDRDHITVNVSQAMRLWKTSGLDEQQFVELLIESRKRVRTYQGKQGLGTINNKMAYFFRVLRQLVGDEDQ
jgi:AraC-like DNA-binding protein